MILIPKNQKAVANNLYSSCINFAAMLKVELVEKENKFTIKEALENDDEFWFDKKDITTDDLQIFCRMCGSYTAYTSERIPTSQINIRISCFHCKSTTLTPKQFNLNSFMIGDESFIMCNSCGQIMKTDENIQFVRKGK